MGWTVPWVSSAASTFNQDLGVSFAPGTTTATYNFAPMDNPRDELAGLPKGRDEVGLDWSMQWLRRHDEYETDNRTS